MRKEEALSENCEPTKSHTKVIIIIIIIKSRESRDARVDKTVQ